MPTAYIISYSLDAVSRRNQHVRQARRALNNATPTNAHYIATLDCYQWNPPPEDICQRYSGVSRVVQEYVMRDPRAVQGVADAVNAVLTAVNRRGHDRVVLKTCCYLGTHRSVTAAEVIGRRLERSGISVHVRHPHRRRGEGDAY